MESITDKWGKGYISNISTSVVRALKYKMVERNGFGIAPIITKWENNCAKYDNPSKRLFFLENLRSLI